MKIVYLLLFLHLFLLISCKSSILDDPSITIEYYVPERSHVKLTIENSYKTTIATLVDSEQFAGAYQISFDANDLAEGIYFYNIEMKGTESSFYYNSTKYMMLVK